MFKTNFVPVVDGSNGGVVTTDPSKVQVLVNGYPVQVTAVDGSTGLYTLAVGVVYGSTLEVTYFTNKYQDTADLLQRGTGPADSSRSLPWVWHSSASYFSSPPATHPRASSSSSR